MMENYQLAEDEVILFKGNVNLKNQDGTTELLVTTQNIILITTIKYLFEEDQTRNIILPINDIKIYNNLPQIKTITKNTIEIYFKNLEIEITFKSPSDTTECINQINQFFTGKTKTERNAEKIKNTIGLINDTFEIDVVHDSKEILINGFVNKIKNPINSLFGKKK